VNIRLWLIEQT